MRLLIIDDDDEMVAEIEFGASVNEKKDPLPRAVKSHSGHDNPIGKEFRERVRGAILSAKERDKEQKKQETTAEREERLFQEWYKNNPFDPDTLRT